MSDLHSYFVAGPENLLPHHILKCEKPEKTLIRIVGELAENGLDIFQLRANLKKLIGFALYDVHFQSSQLVMCNTFYIKNKPKNQPKMIRF